MNSESIYYVIERAKSGGDSGPAYIVWRRSGKGIEAELAGKFLSLECAQASVNARWHAASGTLAAWALVSAANDVAMFTQVTELPGVAAD